MKEILDFIVGNTFLFIGVILFLVATFLVLLKSIVKTINNRKIAIYEEEEPKELEKVKEKDIIEKPINKKEEKNKENVEEITEESINSEEESEINEKNVDENKVEKETEDDEKEMLPEEIISYDEPDKEKLELVEDKEIEERIDKVYKKDLKEELDNSANEEIKDLLSDISTTKAVDPEEVVKSFEAEQEAQSIISYQELVDVVKNRETDFEDELENKPLSTVSDFIEEKEKVVESDIEVLEIIEQLEKTKDNIKDSKIEDLMSIADEDVELLEPSVEEIEVLEPAKEKIEEKEIKLEINSEIPNEGKFKKTDVISPIFGKMDDAKKVDYPKVEKFNRDNINKNEELAKKVMQSVEQKIEQLEEKHADNIEEKEKEAAEALKSFSSMFENLSEKIEEKNGIVDEEYVEEEIESLTADSSIAKNEDFLKALKDFRNSL